MHKLMSLGRHSQRVLKILSWPVYKILPPSHGRQKPLNFNEEVNNVDFVNRLIGKAIKQNTPFMVARLGATEARICAHYYINRHLDLYNRFYLWIYQGVPRQRPDILAKNIHILSGFFPPSSKMLDFFCELYIKSLQFVDVLGSFNAEESFFKERLKDSFWANLYEIEPFFAANPWTYALKGKKVLVIHPFDESITYQYNNNRLNLFDRGDILPDFELMTMKAVQTIAGNPSEFSDWFQALDYMTDKCLSMNFDVAIIGCGAYGLPLAARLKKSGKIAIHLGGVTQILFGIKGKRWNELPVSRYYNSFWRQPLESETPSHSDAVENGCYW